MQSRPIFRNKFEIGVWNDLDRCKTSDELMKISEKVSGRRGDVCSAVLVRLMNSMFEKCGSRSMPMMEKLATKGPPGSCTPFLTLAYLYAEAGDADRARSISGSVADPKDIPLYSCVQARISVLENDPTRAKRDLMRARCSDPTYPLFYEAIQRLEPSEGWPYRQSIESLAESKDPESRGERDVPERISRLYRIYHEWYRGSRDTATDEMIRSEGYATKDPEYILASARMSVDERDWHSARMMYDTLVSKSPNCAYILTEAANAYLHGGNTKRASELYSDALSLYPGSSKALTGLIRAYLSMGMKKDATSMIRSHMGSENASFESYQSIADMLMGESMYPEAAEIWGLLKASYPDDPDVYVRISENEFMRGDMNSALDAASDAVRRDKRSIAARIQRAKVFMRIGKVKKASSDLKKAHRSDPKDTDVMLLMKDVAVVNGDDKEAAKLCKAILEIDPGNIEASDALSGVRSREESRNSPYSFYRDAVLADYRPENFINIISSMVRDGMCKEAVELCRENDREFGRMANVKKLRGNAEYAIGDYDAASRSFASAAMIDPRDPVAWHSKGMADEAMGDLDSAEEAFNKAVLMNLDESEFWISRASIQDKKGDHDGAVESLNRAIGLRPDSAYALMRKGMIFANHSRFEEAIYFVDMALTIDPDDVGAYRIQRDICVASGSCARTARVCEEIIRRDPTDLESVSVAVAAYRGMDDADRASELVGGLLQKSPDSIPLLLIRRDLCTSIGDTKGAADTCRRILRIQPDNRSVRSDTVDGMESRGRADPAGRIHPEMERASIDPLESMGIEIHVTNPEQGIPDRRSSNGTARRDVPDAVKRLAEKTLRRAYTSRSRIDDPDLMDSLNLDPDMAEEVLGYLSDIPECGSMVPGTPRFERMEKLSVGAIVKGGRSDMESDPEVPVQCAYVAGGAKDADEAKLLVSYIRDTMVSDIDERVYADGFAVSVDIGDASTVYEVMKRSGLGVYRARALLERR